MAFVKYGDATPITAIIVPVNIDDIETKKSLDDLKETLANKQEEKTEKVEA